MEYAAVGLALLGLAVGTLYRLSTLIPIVIALFLLSIGFAIVEHLGLFSAVIVIMGAQTILQGSYFLGLLARAFIIDRWPPLSGEAPATERNRTFLSAPTLRPGGGLRG